MDYILTITYQDLVRTRKTISREEASRIALGFGMSWPYAMTSRSGGDLKITLESAE